MEEKLYTFTEHKIYGHESYNGLNSHQTSTKQLNPPILGAYRLVLLLFFNINSCIESVSALFWKTLDLS